MHHGVPDGRTSTMKMNKIRKSVIAVLLCALVVSSLTACGSKKKDTAEPSAEPPAQQTDASGQESTVEEVNGAGQQDPQPQQAPAEAAGHSGTEYAAQDNVDLTGNWAQKDMEGSDSYVAGYISDGVVEIFLMSEKGSKGSLYWSGTYVPQTTPGTPYTWDSVNDRDRTGQAEIGCNLFLQRPGLFVALKQLRQHILCPNSFCLLSIRTPL